MDIISIIDRYLISEKKGVCKSCGRKQELDDKGLCKDCAKDKKPKRGGGFYV